MTPHPASAQTTSTRPVHPSSGPQISPQGCLAVVGACDLRVLDGCVDVLGWRADAVRTQRRPARLAADPAGSGSVLLKPCLPPDGNSPTTPGESPPSSLPLARVLLSPVGDAARPTSATPALPASSFLARPAGPCDFPATSVPEGWRPLLAATRATARHWWDTRPTAPLSSLGPLTPQTTPPCFLVAGPKGAGKSTLCRLLINALLDEAGDRDRGAPGACLLDSDLGRPLLFSPGVAGLALLTRPLVGDGWVGQAADSAAPCAACSSGAWIEWSTGEAVEKEDEEEDEESPHAAPSPPWCACGGPPHPPEPGVWLGEATPEGDPVALAAAVDRAATAWAASSSPTGLGLGCPLVVNTHGWTRGTGADVLREVARATRPSHVVVLTGADRQGGERDREVTAEGLAAESTAAGHDGPVAAAEVPGAASLGLGDDGTSGAEAAGTAAAAAARGRGAERARGRALAVLLLRLAGRDPAAVLLSVSGEEHSQSLVADAPWPATVAEAIEAAEPWTVDANALVVADAAPGPAPQPDAPPEPVPDRPPPAALVARLVGLCDGGGGLVAPALVRGAEGDVLHVLADVPASGRPLARATIVVAPPAGAGWGGGFGGAVAAVLRSGARCSPYLSQHALSGGGEAEGLPGGAHQRSRGGLGRRRLEGGGA